LQEPVVARWHTSMQIEHWPSSSSTPLAIAAAAGAAEGILRDARRSAISACNPRITSVKERFTVSAASTVLLRRRAKRCIPCAGGENTVAPPCLAGLAACLLQDPLADVREHNRSTLWRRKIGKRTKHLEKESDRTSCCQHRGIHSERVVYCTQYMSKN
jgi:hypothetical protein